MNSIGLLIYNIFLSSLVITAGIIDECCKQTCNILNAISNKITPQGLLGVSVLALIVIIIWATSGLFTILATTLLKFEPRRHLVFKVLRKTLSSLKQNQIGLSASRYVNIKLFFPRSQPVNDSKQYQTS